MRVGLEFGPAWQRDLLFDKGKIMLNRVITILIVVSVCTGCQPQQHRVGAVKKQYNASTAEVYLPLAQDQCARGQYQAAADSANKVVEAAPQMPQAHIVLGKSLCGLGRKSEAMAQFKTASDLDPSAAEAWYGLAVLSEDSQDRPTAIRYLETAVACPDAGSDAIIHLADNYVSAGDGPKALSLLEERCRTMGGNPDIMKAAAALNLRLGHPDRAVILYEGLCQASPKDARLMEMLGYAYIDAGRQSDAAELFERLCEKSPAAAPRYVQASAGCYIRDGKYDRAVALCDRYASVCKDDAAFWLVMGRAAIGTRDPSRALYAAKRAMAAEPASADARTLMGCALYTDGRYADALDTFAQLPDAGSFVWLVKGRCYDKLGDRAAAVAAFQQALKLDPANTAAARHMKDIANGTTSNIDLTPGGDVHP
jgi:tetratricopeptide (TPR) repeat protein